MVMRVRCVCGEEKPHGQICWIRLEVEIPDPNNDEHYIESSGLQREISICRSCFKRLLNSRLKGKNKGGPKGEKNLLDVLRKRIDIETVDDNEMPSVLDCVSHLAYDLHNDRAKEELKKVREEGRVAAYSESL